MSERQLTTCRGCGAPIFFAETPAGKLMPLEEKELLVAEVVTDPATGKASITRQVRGHVSHFASCPKASEFRSPKPLQNG